MAIEQSTNIDYLKLHVFDCIVPVASLLRVLWESVHPLEKCWHILLWEGRVVAVSVCTIYTLVAWAGNEKMRLELSVPGNTSQLHIAVLPLQ